MLKISKVIKNFLLIFFLTVSCNKSFAKAERVKPEDIQSIHSEDSTKIILDAMRIIKEEYVNTISDQKLAEYAINGMLSSLDPHSAYLNREETAELAMHSSGEFEGVGIEVTSDNGLIRVVSPIDDGPAYNVGIKSGDYIISIDDENIYGLSTYEAIQKIRGKPHSKVKLTIIREDSASPVEYILNREKVKIQSVKSYIIDNDILYIRISYFYGNTFETLVEQIKSYLKNKEIKSIILDLRNNPGGFLDQSIKVASMFIEKGNIVYTKGKKDINAVTYPVYNDTFKVTNIPIAVLVNNGTASAAEIVTGALQDHRKAAVLGTKTFGKGSVQAIIDIDEGKSISLTTSLYYTPSGKSIQLEGITPDILIEDVEVKKIHTNDTFREEDIKGHLNRTKNIIKEDKETKSSPGIIEKIKRRINLKVNKNNIGIAPNYKRDLMITRAVDLLKGVNIYKQTSSSSCPI